MSIVQTLEQGIIIHGDSFKLNLTPFIDNTFGDDTRFPLIICDPPYGDIVDEDWDVDDYHKWMKTCALYASIDATICIWGGVGKPGNRPFIDFASTVEAKNPDWIIKNWVTWKKKRAYGVKDNYLFTREECLILTKGKPIFNIPLLDEKRGYAGYNAKYPAKSEYLRRTNVWTDITELFRNKIHPCQKPDKLYEVLINTHSNPDDLILDLCAGSCVTMRAAINTKRRYCVVEKEIEYINAALTMKPFVDEESSDDMMIIE
jgi:DNA modification methylase